MPTNRRRGYATYFGEEICTTGSPWAVDGLINASGVRAAIDHELHALHCRLSERSGRGYKSFLPGDGAPAYAHLRWPLTQLEQMWRRYTDGVPKFAVYSANVVHEGQYGKDLAQHMTGLSAYDGYLADFLDGLLRRPEADTLVLVHGDHGVQDGPKILDLGTQWEQRAPWARLLVPRALVPDVARLRTNAQRLSTAHDLYATLRGVLLGRPGQRQSSRARRHGLTSSEARIPQAYCPCQHERLPGGRASGVWLEAALVTATGSHVHGVLSEVPVSKSE
ncbi:hypothetical protein EMIHUDRAFT_245594 [Emiliania huxleyi CCMP1516]|uniref:Sulfatase N-terminal domain-containing protein n=2 Tax=Emiliania huxleyi TaxID=2903 RepID=A0A0D3IX03_EMIH1|nr:hypothetical protein EMIHUDRAFT_245594 [Emiliania huxleyi CCMP1516]EOD15788.1 hypothetical protein EMIHUDRAFT_245594 [Emiliania huxleyi CCMP1516]|eukprot:XP_005768217.1 hypothetical protein EMIHUDRAFT_245594 [Emiliania huxleyi CCMP1516]